MTSMIFVYWTNLKKRKIILFEVFIFFSLFLTIFYSKLTRGVRKPVTGNSCFELEFSF